MASFTSKESVKEEEGMKHHEIKLSPSTSGMWINTKDCKRFKWFSNCINRFLPVDRERSKLSIFELARENAIYSDILNIYKNRPHTQPLIFITCSVKVYAFYTSPKRHIEVCEPKVKVQIDTSSLHSACKLIIHNIEMKLHGIKKFGEKKKQIKDLYIIGMDIFGYQPTSLKEINQQEKETKIQDKVYYEEFDCYNNSTPSSTATTSKCKTEKKKEEVENNSASSDKHTLNTKKSFNKRADAKVTSCTNAKSQAPADELFEVHSSTIKNKDEESSKQSSSEKIATKTFKPQENSSKNVIEIMEDEKSTVTESVEADEQEIKQAIKSITKIEKPAKEAINTDTPTSSSNIREDFPNVIFQDEMEYSDISPNTSEEEEHQRMIVREKRKHSPLNSCRMKRTKSVIKPVANNAANQLMIKALTEKAKTKMLPPSSLPSRKESSTERALKYLKPNSSDPDLTDINFDFNIN